MSYILNQLLESIILNLIEIALLSVIFYFVFKAAIKNALREVVKEEIIPTLKNNNNTEK